VITARSEGGVHLRDVGSTNGTFLAGHRVDSAWLKPGSTLRLGATHLRFDQLTEEVREPLAESDRCGRMLGSSVAMRRIFALVPRLAVSSATILLEAETGTGKTLLAEAIHRAGDRAKQRFVVVDCGAIPPTLIESELFGHERGAFTGATQTRIGAFEAAAGGTILLDEVGELPLEMQPKILRVLEDRTVKRVGTIEELPIDVRVIAATNRDLRLAVNRGAFRADLFYRLNTVRLRLPPLRERREDIPFLIEHFYQQFTGSSDPAPPEMVSTFLSHEWPGNIRELRGAVERAVLMGDLELWNEVNEPTVEPAPDVFDPHLSFRAAKDRAVGRWERWYVRELYARAGNNLSKAARAARMDRAYLRDLLRRHHARVDEE